MNKKISPRLNIKSSLAKHLDALLTAYVLWVINDRPYRLAYAEEQLENGKRALFFTDEEVAGLNSFFNSTDITQASSNKNPLLNTQIEPLQVGCINMYKAFNLEFQDKAKPESCERTGGERFLKELVYTSAIDLLDGFLIEKLQSFKGFVKPVFLNGDLDLESDFAKNLGKLLTFLVEQTRFNDNQQKQHDFLRDAVDIGDFHENGPSRIIKPFIKSGLHDFVKFNKDEKQYACVNDNDFANYRQRADFFAAIFSPNYTTDDESVEVPVVKDREAKYELDTTDVPLNLLLKGVPGTGKSRAIDNIIDKNFDLGRVINDAAGTPINRVLRVNVHSASTNSSLMQGISVTTGSKNEILYDEKIGLVLNFVLLATQHPTSRFALVLEEIQENSLNALIGDLIYLVEKSKRTFNYTIDSAKPVFDEIYRLTIDGTAKHFVTIPTLINGSNVEKRLIMPGNLHLFCTSNYRDDQKIIEDNLLRRIDVVELYPKHDVIKQAEVAEFLKSLNDAILNDINELQPDRLLIGHANWIDVDDTASFYRALLKVVVEFKDIKDIEYNQMAKVLSGAKMPFGIDLSQFDNYMTLVEHIQKESGYSFVSSQ
ncbi:5-methylcytosine-specific restriction endonuclease subunit McrB [Paraglaciecola chathamensis]|uniref:ATPase dynein-related AAA domain-containing protein n=1 Tax=Paraglaciecola chathamensis S18K6 TaxID=1127672 RepID=A0AAV3V543_9ALTE|nr:hypothetical protein [Paraglaciecola chathamensis]GAC11822.1 hypothetical protein GCHA_3892 [Paraglaciecola chathamensis S18K6]